MNPEATEFLWMMVSVYNWEQLTEQAGSRGYQYIDRMQAAAVRVLVSRP